MVTSEPVPEVVGITKMVLTVLADYAHLNISVTHHHLQSPKMLVAFEVSITEPPPTAIIASQLLSR